MGAEVPVSPVPEHHEPVVERAIHHMLAGIPPAGGGQGRVHRALGQRLFHLRHRHLHQARVAVGAVTLIGDPIGPQIAFLEDMQGNAAGARYFRRLGVHGAGVAIEYDISDRMRLQQLGEPRGPFGQRISIGDVALAVRPEYPVTRVEADPLHAAAGGLQHAAKRAEERPMRALQEQEAACWARVLRHMCSIWPLGGLWVLLNLAAWLGRF